MDILAVITAAAELETRRAEAEAAGDEAATATWTQQLTEALENLEKIHADVAELAELLKATLDSLRPQEAAPQNRPLRRKGKPFGAAKKLRSVSMTKAIVKMEARRAKAVTSGRDATAEAWAMELKRARATLSAQMVDTVKSKLEALAQPHRSAAGAPARPPDAAPATPVDAPAAAADQPPAPTTPAAPAAPDSPPSDSAS